MRGLEHTKRYEIKSRRGKMVRPNIWELKAREDVEGLIRALKDSNPYVRKEAAEALGKIGDERAVEPLIEALKDSYLAVRWKAAEALSKIGERAAGPLIEALKDSDEYVRMGAAGALGEIGDSRAVEPLIEALKDSNADVRSSAAIALGEIGDRRAVGPLIEALKDSNEFVREEAAEALGEIVKKAKMECESLIERLKNLRNLGIDTEIEWKLRDVLKKLEKGNYFAAIKIKACKKELERMINEQIRGAKEFVKGVCGYVSVPEAEELIRNAESALKICDYENAVKLAKQAEEKAKQAGAAEHANRLKRKQNRLERLSMQERV